MNLPNKLTCLRMIMIPFFLFFLIFPEVCGFTASRIIAVVLFALTSLTDMLDGKIARKYNMITDFGKFMDPLADKLMVFGAMIGILAVTFSEIKDKMYSLVSADADFQKNAFVFGKVFAIVAFVIIFRELAVTSMRMIVSNTEGIVIAANIFGKFKTVSQIAGIIIILLEPLFWNTFIISYVFSGIMVITTLFSGFTYFKAYWPYINSNK